VVEIVSYRRVHRLVKRIYRIDRWRLPRPVPVAGVCYWALFETLFLTLSFLPLFGIVFSAVLPVGMRLIFLPLLLTMLMLQRRGDERETHRAIIAHVKMRCADWRAALEDEDWSWDCPVASDGHEARLLPGVVRGPATVNVNAPVSLHKGWASGRRGCKIVVAADPNGIERTVRLHNQDLVVRA
jgi:TcpE family